MRKIMYAALASTAALAFMSDVEEIVLVKGADGKPVRTSKAAFDADQAEGGEKTMTEYKGKVEAEPSVPAGTVPIGGPPLAAPSAPNFGGGTDPDANIDPLKNAVAPAANAPNARLVMKIGAKFFVVGPDGAKLDIDGIDVKGYQTEEGAWQAVRQLPSPGTNA